MLFQPHIQLMQCDIGEDGAGHSALRGPGVGRRQRPGFHDFSLEQLADEVNEAFIP